MKRTALLLIVCLVAPALAFAEIDVRITGGMEAAVTFQRVDYQVIDRRPEPLTNPLWVGGFGRDGRDLPKFHLGISASANDRVGFNGRLDFIPPWNDSRVTGDFEGVPVRAPLLVEIVEMAGWFQPFPWMRLNVGNFHLNNLRGQIEGFGWQYYLGVTAGGTDGFFTRFEGSNAVAMELINPLAALAPNNPWLEGFWFGAMVYDMFVSRVANNAGIHGGIKEAQFLFQNVQFAVGYEIPNIGHLRFQYIGVQPMANARRITDNDNNDDNGGTRSQAAFTFTAVPNLAVEIGGTFSHLVVDPINRIPAITPDGEYETALRVLEGEYLNPHRVGIGIEYNFIDLLGLDLSVRTGFEFNWGGFTAPYGAGRTDIGTVAKIWLSPSVRVNDFVFGIDAGLNILGDEHYFERLNNRGGYRYGFGTWARWNAFANCFIKVGVFYAGGEALGLDRVEPRRLDSVLTIPVLFSISF